MHVSSNQGWIRETCGLQLVKEQTLCSLAVGIAYGLVLVSVRALCS